MHITNNHRTPLSLPNQQVLQPGIPTPVMGWAELKKNAVIAAWVKAGVLREGDAPPNPEGSKLLPPDKEALAAELTALGVKFHPNTGVAKLQALLEEAKANKPQEILHGSDTFPAHIEIAEGVTVQLGDIVGAAFTASGLDAEAWNALSAEERDGLLTAEVDKRKAEAAKA